MVLKLVIDNIRNIVFLKVMFDGYSFSKNMFDGYSFSKNMFDGYIDTLHVYHFYRNK